MHVAVCFTNFGPYHLARLRALGHALERRGWRLSALEVAGRERRYPWRVDAGAEPFDWVTLFPGSELEELSAIDCRRALIEWANAARPDVFGIVGYSRPECMAALRWARARGRPAVLLSESQAIDKPRVWWREAIKSSRVRRFSSALVGGPRHRDYLRALGMPADRIALGYNAVDNDRIARLAQEVRNARRSGPPARPYFLAVNRFVPEKNLIALLRAYAAYRAAVGPGAAWDLALCGDGPLREPIDALVDSLGLEAHVHRPGFLQEAALVPWYADAGAFVHASLMEPWGLVVNEAAACGLPLVVSDRCGCVETLVPEGGMETSSGYRFDPTDPNMLTDRLRMVTEATPNERRRMGERARAIVADWGPDRFATGMLEAIALAGPRAAARVIRVKPR
jgi:glycosyltransferase involved in cell wall biosynthesis